MQKFLKYFFLYLLAVQTNAFGSSPFVAVCISGAAAQTTRIAPNQHVAVAACVNSAAAQTQEQHPPVSEWTEVQAKPLSRKKQNELKKAEKATSQAKWQAKQAEKDAQRQIDHQAFLVREARRQAQAESLYQVYAKQLNQDQQPSQPIQNIKAVFLQEVERMHWLKEQTKKVGAEQASRSALWNRPSQVEEHPFFAASVEREMMQGNREHPWRMSIQEFLKSNESKNRSQQRFIAQTRFQPSLNKLAGNQQAASSASATPKPELPNFNDQNAFPALGSSSIADQEERARQVMAKQRQQLCDNDDRRYQHLQSHVPVTQASSQSRSASIASGMMRLFDY